MVRNIYVITNYTKKEKYFGTTEKPVDERVREHQKGDTDALEHWWWNKDDIRYTVLAQGVPDQEAIDLAHEQEKTTPEPGWKHIQTTGQ